MRKYIQKKSVSPIPPTSGSVSDTLNVTDETTNAPSIRLLQELLANISGGGSSDGTVSALPIGAGCDFFGSTAPVNYMFADGSELSRTEYSELFQIIGTAYGEGDGSTTFNLPDKRERVSIMKGDTDELGEKVGSNSVTLDPTNLPKVSLGEVVTNVTRTRANTWDIGKSSASVTEVTVTKGTLELGEDTPTTIDNRQSSLICNYIIRVK